MANAIIEVRVKIKPEKIRQLWEYKSIADEALSALNELQSTDPEINHIRELALRALIIGAKICD